jgi:hypothetical protein
VIERDWDDNEPVCLDTSAFHGDECPVVLFHLHPDDSLIERLAPNFPTWYANYLEPYWKTGRLTSVRSAAGV